MLQRFSSVRAAARRSSCQSRQHEKREPPAADLSALLGRRSAGIYHHSGRGGTGMLPRARRLSEPRVGTSKEHRRFRVIMGAGAGLRRDSGCLVGTLGDLYVDANPEQEEEDSKAHEE